MKLELKMHSKNKSHIEASILYDDKYVGWIESNKQHQYIVYIDSKMVQDGFTEWVDCFKFIKSYFSVD